MSALRKRTVGKCPCVACQLHPYGKTAKEHRRINRMVVSLDERSRRRFVGFLAEQLGEGGISQVAHITGMSRHTIRRGKNEQGKKSTQIHASVRKVEDESVWNKKTRIARRSP